MAPRILLVEDDALLAESLVVNLQSAGLQPIHCSRGDEGLDLVRRDRFDLIILDIMLPGMDGYSVARALRASRNFTPILMLTARQLRADVIEGLDAGADDYLTKPFDLGELLARVQSLMRRRQWFDGGAQENQTLEFGDVRVDFRNLKATVRGREIDLPFRMAMIMKYFAEHQGEIVTREDLLRAVWSQETGYQTRTVDNYLVKLRRLFEPKPKAPRYLVTVHGVGYRFLPDGAPS